MFFAGRSPDSRQNSGELPPLDSFTLPVPLAASRTSPLLKPVMAGSFAPTLTVILPCYLPNEQGILEETINHLRRRLEYPIAFELLLCYNTPHAMPEVEGWLQRARPPPPSLAGLLEPPRAPPPRPPPPRPPLPPRGG